MPPARTLILGTAGHIDHGKTALVRALTGIDTDRLPQEKARGITIDIGFANLDLGEITLGIVDVPGHERFIRNMLAGASGIDLALLVIAADDAVMPQTREHLAILKLLNIHHGVIALSKIDLVEESWLGLVEDDIRGLVADSFLADAPIVRTSATTGAGIDELKNALRELTERADETESGALFRLAIDRSFMAQGVGTIVTGSVNSGELSAGEEIEWVPVGKRVRVRGLQSHGREVETIHRGQRAAINLMGVHHTEIARGHELAAPGWLTPGRMMSVRVHCLAESPWPIRHRARVRLHLGTQEIMAGVRLLEGNEIAPGESALAQLVLAEPGVAVSGQPFVLRTESPLVTVGGGNILQPATRRIKRRDSGALARLAELESTEPAKRAAAAIFFFGARSWTALDLAREAAIRMEESDEMIRALVAEGTLIEIGAASGRSMILHRDVLDRLEERLLRALRQLHEANPLLRSIPRGRVFGRLKYLGEAVLFGAIADRLISRGAITGDEHAIAHPESRPKLSSGQQELMKKLVATYEQARFMPPDVKELAKTLNVSGREIRQVLDLSVAAGDVVHLGGPLYMHESHEKELRDIVRMRLETGDGLAVADIRDLLGTSRKYAVPMCEYLDRIGLTTRRGDLRILAGTEQK